MSLGGTAAALAACNESLPLSFRALHSGAVVGGLSAEVRGFITRHIVSVEELEVLIVLLEGRDRDWTRSEINAKILTQESSIAKWLGVLVSLGLAKEVSEAKFRFSAASPELEHLTIQTAAAYRQRWTKVIEFIFAKPNEQLLNFTRAFELRKRP